MSRLEQLKKQMQMRVQSKARRESKTVHKDIIFQAVAYLEASKARREAEAIIKQYSDNLKAFIREEKPEDLELITPVGKLTLTTQYRNKVTSIYTSYDVDYVEKLVPKEYHDLVFKKVVNRDTLEALVNQGVITKDVLKGNLAQPIDFLNSHHFGV